jgi:hypothetical protein
MINKKRKPTPVKVTAKVTEETQPEVTQPEPAREEKVTQPIEEVTPTHVSAPQIKVGPPPKPKPLTIASLKAETDELRTLIQSLSAQMADVQSQLLLRRKPTANNKVQIRDKQTGKIYKSKNNVYQTMLKAGELKDLACFLMPSLVMVVS